MAALLRRVWDLAHGAEVDDGRARRRPVAGRAAAAEDRRRAATRRPHRRRPADRAGRDRSREDFVHLTFSFSNLRFDGAQNSVPVLKRAVARRPAFLIVDCHPQHVTERALFERAENLKVKDPPPPAQPDPDKPPVAGEPLPPPPIFASIAGPTRLAFKVTNHSILYSVSGLLEAMRTLDLNVAPHATPPSFARLPHFSEILVSDAVDLTRLFARGPSVGVARGRRVVDSPMRRPEPRPS